MFEKIENVVFDLGGVLVDIDLERCREAFRRIGMPQMAAFIDAYHPAAMIGRMEAGELSVHETCDEIRRLTGRTEATDEAIAGAYTEIITGIPAAKIRQVAALRRRGVHTYVLSNNNPASMALIRAAFEREGLPMEVCFERMYLSYEMKLLKPSEEIFRAMIADSGMQPERTLFIDDSEKNVTTARGLGFAVYCPAPGEDFGPLLDEVGR